ncbi:hypothetical protein CcaverHIS002_0603440 [Cutaneotrichosporon cavernicola]|uniref:Uncharacterized protein n=1 Tax=Cutaneotrichosporon cavernicola TaxID=279322 RepID=A0AA48L8F6_9TREE|nr:uncharacterized protein CcaverHIS019_0602910 [Cutaneotrichosporon cavernicola]BEI86057.1 hypothetical protein CcaverHIS002_0603440 [Cutaneotrichosporon cavernicola]BEI93832.1 hypothetical protein CcaverHIS019_0602910 [Cutaneotrichosporon cavernicola]BEJ01608.1 hypothetical protein CcaverHIS631_0602900 [Cutaneotrichosporon cavernicola]BEJ09376.1 hypothetical protein CcaverHIS641_0602910 [Cutaneotrichosporon cavernicola]
MPTETTERSPPPATLKCAECGAASLGPTDGVLILGETMDRVCAACVRTRGGTQALASPIDLDLYLSRLRLSPRQHAVVIDLAAASRLLPCRSPSPSSALPVSSPSSSTGALPESPPTNLPSLPESTVVRTGTPKDAQKNLPRTSSWATAPTPASPTSPALASAPSTYTGPNPLLDVGRGRARSDPRGCLYPGAVFKGTQRSGRSAYDVEIRLVDVSFINSTCCGYLTIANLTDTHPELTTFFDGEIIGPKYGFTTGQRFGATEVDDRRHWERFEPYLRASTKADIVRPEMLLRDPLPSVSRGETQARERDFVFLRIKEKFLVPDHTVRDISGASFAGFYYAMVDMAPNDIEPDWSVDACPRPVRRQSTSVVRPDVSRRMSVSTSGRRASTSTTRPDPARRMSTARMPPPPEPTLRGYYFHSLNNEFQELFVRHVPSSSAGTFEMR